MSSFRQYLSPELPPSGTLLSPPPPPLPSNISHTQKTPSIKSSLRVPYLSEAEDPGAPRPGDESYDEYSNTVSTPRLRKRKSLVERQKSRFDRIFNESSNLSTRDSLHFRSDDEEGALDHFGTVDPSEPHNLLKGCYATIAGLRVEIDSWQMRARDAQSRVISLEEDKRLLMAERNVLQQRLLEAEQESASQRSRAQTLSAEVDTLDLEIDKLSRDNHRLRKLAYRQDECDGRIAELEEMLGESQRISTTAEARYQKLLAQNEKLKKAHRKLQQSSQRGGADAEVYEKVAWLRESNEKLQFALSSLSNLDLSPEAPPSQTTMLVGVIHQLISDNGRLKTDAMGYCDLIADIQAENQQMRGQVQSFGSKPLPNASPKAPNRLKLRRRNSLTPDDQRQSTLLDELKRCGASGSSLPKSPGLHKYHSMVFSQPDSSKRESGIFTTTVPMKHLYQDEWMSVSESESEEISYSRMQTPIPAIIEPSSRTPRPSRPRARPAHAFVSKSIPLESLVAQTQNLLDRLQASEPKILNRKLQRSFHLPALAPISNTLINNIQQNIDLLPARFQPPRPKPRAALSHSRSLSFGDPPLEPDIGQAGKFMELVGLVQTLLGEIAHLRLGINHLSLAFVHKMNDIAQSPTPHQSHHWPSLPQPQPPSLLRCIPPTPKAPPSPRTPSHRHTKSTPDSCLRRSPMQTRNGVVDYSPRASLTLDPALVTPSLPLIPPDSCIPLHFASSNSRDVLRKLAGEFRPKPGSAKRIFPSSPVVALTREHAERAAVVCHPYSLIGSSLP